MADLQQCQARLLTSVSVATEQTSSEVILVLTLVLLGLTIVVQLIPYFDICTQDRYTVSIYFDHTNIINLHMCRISQFRHHWYVMLCQHSHDVKPLLELLTLGI